MRWPHGGEAGKDLGGRGVVARGARDGLGHIPNELQDALLKFRIADGAVGAHQLDLATTQLVAHRSGGLPRLNSFEEVGDRLAQQHGELASYMAPPPPPNDRKLMRENAKHTLRRATDDWVEGRISTKEHAAVHQRAKHVLSGKPPHEFKGPSGERSFKKIK